MATPIVSTLTQERVREMIDYDQDTGLVTVKISYSNRTKVGTVLRPSRGCAYVRFQIDGQPYKVHRLIWLYVHGVWPVGDIDHINGDPSDNRLCNLRDVPHSINTQNIRRAESHNKSGLIGAHKYVGGRYTARVNLAGVCHRLGYFDTPEEAHAAYVVAKRRLHEGCTL